MTDNNIFTCEKCGNKTEIFRKGRTQGLRCTKCDWSVATTYTQPILADQIIYTLKIETGNYQNPDHIKAIANAIGGNFLKARIVLKSLPSIIYTGNAQHVIKLQESLLAAGLGFSVDPKFP
jgi:hypothetical protein